MFRRLHQNEYEGTGIGLAVCKKIVQFYNGQIWFESQEGYGTTFYFVIPAEELGISNPKQTLSAETVLV